MRQMKSPFRHVLASGALAFALVATAACGGGGSDASPAAADEQDTAAFPADGLMNKQDDTVRPVRGGTLTVSTYLPTGSLDPAKSAGQASAGGLELNAIFDTLVRYDMGSNKYVPQLAESLTPSSDFTTWTLKLRPDVTFSDGTPLDSAAVVASLQRMVAMKARSASLIQEATSIEATDDLTVVFGLDDPWSGFPYVLASLPGNIVSPTAVQALGDEFDRHPVGAGPFVVEEFLPGESLVLKPRTDYWGGEPYLEHLKFVSVVGGQATLTSLQGGEVQVAYLREADVVHEAREAGLPGYLVAQNSGELLHINNAPGRPGSDIRIRRAIAAAIDPVQMDQRVNNGLGNPGTALFQESSIWHTDNSGPEHDPTKARQLLEAAKQDGFDGALKLVTPNSPHAQARSIVIQAQLQSIGFSVELDNNNTVADFIAKTSAGGPSDFDIALSGTVVLDEAPYVALARYYASDSRQNISGYKSPELDDLLQQLKVAPDEAAQRSVIGQIQQLWTDEVPVLPLSALGVSVAWGTNVHGLKTTVSVQVLFDKAFIVQ